MALLEGKPAVVWSQKKRVLWTCHCF